MSANLGNVNRKWRSNAEKAGGARDTAMGVIQLRAARPNELPDYDPNESDAQIMTKLKTRFEVLDGMTRDVVDGKVRGLVVSGPGGVGKTETITQVLQEAFPDEDQTNYTVSKGYVKATGLYKLLWEHRHPGNILIFDDADSIWFDDTALQFLKVATDTLRKNSPRTLTYGAEYNMVDNSGEVIPRRFDYEGSIIFLTNLDLDKQIDAGTKLSKHMEAMITRCHYIDLAMRTKRDYLMRIYQVADEGLFSDFNMTREQEDEVLTFMVDHMPYLRELSLRMALKIAGLRMNESNAGSWDKVAKVTCCRGIA